MNYKQSLTITFVATKKNIGNFSDNDIEAVRKSHCPAAQALLYAYAKIQGSDANPTPVEIPNQPKIRNTVAVKAEVTLEDAVRILDAFDRNQDTQAYQQKQQLYLSLMQRYGKLSSLTPATRAEAMKLMQDASYSYIKTEAKCNLEEAVSLKTYNKSTGKSGIELRKVIQSKTRHKLCGINEFPDESTLKSFVESIAPKDSVKWLEAEDSDSQYSSSSTEESTSSID